MRKPVKDRILASESGMMLVQVLLVSAVLLLIVYSGFRSVQGTIQIANRAATSASFQDLVLLIKQTLSGSNECMDRLGGKIIGPQALSLMQNPKEKHPLNIRWPDGSTLLQVEVPGTALPKGAFVSPEFRVKEISLSNFRKIGRSQADVSADSGFQTTEHFTGSLTVVADRRAEMFGQTEMRANIDLFFHALPADNQIASCTMRSPYLLQLGPPDANFPPNVKRKSGMECIDRGGQPLLKTSTDWYICRFPKQSMMFCQVLPFQHWFCESSTGDNIYAY